MTKIVCSVCGSDDVQAKAWVKLNENCEKTCDCIDELIAEPADCWCCNCEENQKLSLVDNEPETLESILENTNKCESFAEIILEEIRSDGEQPHHIGANIIKAYINGDCDALLIALCGWSMDTLLEKYKSNHKYYICPACQKESLKYAMIDLDDTNIEEGYSCSECGAEYLGPHNEEVITQNPKITK